MAVFVMNDGESWTAIEDCMLRKDMAWATIFAQENDIEY